MRIILIILCAFVSIFSQIRYQADYSIIRSYKYGPTIGDNMAQALQLAEQRARIQYQRNAIAEQEQKLRQEHFMKIAVLAELYKDSVKYSSLIDSTEEYLVLTIGIPDTIIYYSSIKALSYVVCYYNVYKKYDFFLKDNKIISWHRRHL